VTEIPGGSLTMFSAFLLGLGLNLTPCVYPMLSITVSLFGGRKENRGHLASFLKAGVYVLGIATMYSALGVAAALTGELFGSLLQSKFVLIGIALLLCTLSLSMFGFYNFQAPAWLIQKIGSEKRAGFLGIYFSGLLVGVFAAPCIGPPVIALLTFVGTRKDVWFAFWIFFVMSLGLGFPYLILGTFSNLIRKLPKSGVWMVWVEHLFGVILLVIAAFYFSIALYPPFLHVLPTVALALAGIYLGFFDQTGKTNMNFARLKKIAGALAVIAGIALLLMQPKETLAWEKYDPAKLQIAREEKKPVILDFYADWCIPCHELDQFTYSNPDVIRALEGFYKIKVDLTNPDSSKSSELIDRFHVQGVPTVIFVGPDGNEAADARIPGFATPEEFLSVIRSLPFETNVKLKK